MSITQKHLRELLQEDQEPFQLNNYIADRRHQLKTKTAATHKFNNSALHHPKKLNKPLATLRKQACFLSFYDSPDFRKSPLYTPTNISPNKSPSAAVFLHIPTKTAAMLLEAAVKIQKQSAKPKKANAKNVGFGMFGSVFKRLKDKSKSNKKPEIDIVNKSCTSSLDENETFAPNRKSTRSKRRKLEGIVEDDVMSVDDKISGDYINELGCSFSCNNSRLSSAGLSESNEDDKSLDMDMETSCSTSRSDFMEEDIIIHEFASCDKHFCLSPWSPFRFALQRSPSPAIRTPDLSSPPASPTRHVSEETENQLGDNLQKNQLDDEEEKDQCSPVSILDPPFEDDDDEQNGGGEEEEEEDDDYDIECSYAFMQRAKLQLLHKLRRFERLAELDPIELEKRMSEEDDEDLIEGEEWINIDEPRSFWSKENDEFVRQVFSKSNHGSLNKIPADFRRLVLDLIAEERKNEINYTNEVIISNVCKRLDSWKEVESNTIDMMVELDLRRELNGWKGYQEEAREKAIEIEIAIFGLLLEELVA